MTSRPKKSTGIVTQIPPKVFPVPTKEQAPGGDNALWRISEWFPDLPKSSLDLLKIYHGELLKFNIRLNLISRTTERDSDEVHFADCLYAARLLEKIEVKNPIYDIGSGNGLPGVVMAILSPKLEFYLVESDSRKCEFLKHLLHVLKIPNCTVMNVRLESLKNEEISTAISRGFASVSKAILAMNKPFASGGQFFHMKGSNWSTEIAEIPSQLMSAWSVELVGEYSLPASQARRAIVCTKKISK